MKVQRCCLRSQNKVCVTQWSAGHLNVFFFFPKTPCSHFHHCVEECCEVSPVIILQSGWGHWDFRFCGLGYFQIGFSVFVPKNFGFSVFVPKNFGFSVLLFISVSGFYAVEHLVFGFRQKYKGVSGIFFDLSSI